MKELLKHGRFSRRVLGEISGGSSRGVTIHDNQKNGNNQCFNRLFLLYAEEGQD